jgi:hypothetical protein
MGDVSLGEFLDNSGLELDDVYSSHHNWTELRRAAGLPTKRGGDHEEPLLRAVGRLGHVDDDLRINAYRSFASMTEPPDPDALDPEHRALLRMFVGSLTRLPSSAQFDQAMADLWSHPQVLDEIVEMLDVRARFVEHLHPTLHLDYPVPVRAHARYTRLEILSAFGLGGGAKPPSWQTGVRYLPDRRTDLFAFTLDKSGGGFSPTTRYRDYAISPTLMHWESQSVTSIDSDTGQRYINHRQLGTNIVLFTRHNTNDRAFWCLGTGRYRHHEGERPIAFVWELDQPLPASLFASFAAAVA